MQSSQAADATRHFARLPQTAITPKIKLSCEKSSIPRLGHTVFLLHNADQLQVDFKGNGWSYILWGCPVAIAVDLKNLRLTVTADQLFSSVFL
ncbi:hypothetical protein PoB_001300500 [Plakobranchus ocellatus]|uniref:Uncharacterized protein n=1 Tax=Plakobranchus ocellatus TaxID=259542 RepID=A0AAV3YVM1_9GAST|nr:hypothetical protein PoB_001300500 [Plakobranchus ocellatus]